MTRLACWRKISALAKKNPCSSRVHLLAVCPGISCSSLDISIFFLRFSAYAHRGQNSRSHCQRTATKRWSLFILAENPLVVLAHRHAPTAFHIKVDRLPHGFSSTYRPKLFSFDSQYVCSSRVFPISCVFCTDRSVMSLRDRRITRYFAPKLGWGLVNAAHIPSKTSTNSEFNSLRLPVIGTEPLPWLSSSFTREMSNCDIQIWLHSADDGSFRVFELPRRLQRVG